MRNKLRRSLAFLLSAVMVVTMSGTPVHAVADRGQPETGLCEHHAAHTDDCGYMEETPGTPCGHEHTEDYYTEVTECVHEHTPECYRSETEDSVSGNEATPANAEKREPENCPHICDKESGCITEKLDCRHEHDSECGYTESTPGTPCTYVCEICNPQDSGEADEEPETGIIKQEQCSCLTLCTEGQINPDCLVCGAENAGLSDCKGKAEKEDTKQPEDTGICKHHQEHDDACGYQPESEDSEGNPCTYKCRICPIEDLIAALPGKVTEDNADEVRAQLNQILALFSVLTEDEQEQIDLSRCYELQGALDGANDPAPITESVEYQEASWDGSQVTYESKTETCTLVENSAEAVTWTAGWYAVSGTVTIDQPITVSGDVSLILTDGCTLTAAKGIVVTDGNSLTIYAQSKNGGTLNATGMTDDSGNASAGIGGSTSSVDSGSITIHGGIINATGGVANNNFGNPNYGGAGIGGSTTSSGNGGNSGTIEIYGGTITANSGAGNLTGAGIGGGAGDNVGGAGSNITIYGGSVTAASTGTRLGGAGIGGGGGNKDGGTGENINIYGGTIKATGSFLGAGIGGGGSSAIDDSSHKSGDGAVTISGGIVTAVGGTNAAGIGGGGGYYSSYTWGGTTYGNGCTGGTGSVTISGGIVDAKGGAGDSSGQYAGDPIGNGGNTTVTATVNKTNAIVFENGAGTVCGDVTLDGSYTVPGDYTLNIPVGASLSGSGTLSGGNAFTTENLTADMISVPTNLYYNGEDRTADITTELSGELDKGITICGQTFTVSGWTVAVSRTDDLHYTATYTNTDNSTTFQKTITLQQSGTTLDGAVKTYNGDTQTTTFTASDTITVKATPTATGQAPANSAMFTTSLAAPAADQMAVFVGDTQVSAPADKGADGSYTMTVSAADVLTLGGVEPNQTITLTAKFVGNTSMANGAGTVDINITAAAKVEKGGVTTYYTEFAEAWKKAQEGAAENPATVTLLADVTLTETLTVTSGQNITLTSAKNSDGNDFTMNYAPEKSTSMSSAIEANGGTFELKGGTINVDDESSHGVYVSGGTFKLTGGAIRVPGDGMHGVYVYGGTATISGGAITVNGHSGSGVKVSSGTAIISGGTITANGSVGNGVMVQSGSTAAISGGAITANGSVGNGVNVTSSGTATITGGTITADNRGVDVSSGTATISGGTITADSRGVYVFKGTATISGGTITADSRGVSVSSGTTTITGGTIKSTGSAIYTDSGTLLEMLGQTGGSPCAYWQGSEPVALTEGQNELPAGTYTVKPCDHSTVTAVDNGNGTHSIPACPACGLAGVENQAHDWTETTPCTVCGAVAVAKVVNGSSTTFVGALADAFTEGNSGATVTLLSEVDLGSNHIRIIANNTFTLDLNGQTVKAAAYNAFLILGGSFTIQDSGTGGKIEGSNTTIEVRGGTLSIESGTVSGFYGVEISGGTVNISGGVISGEEKGLWVYHFGKAVLSGGTLIGGDAVFINTNASVTLKNLLAEGYAYHRNNLPVTKAEGWVDSTTWGEVSLDTKAALTGTVTVKKCNHTGEGVCEYTPNEGAETHDMTCLACGYAGAAESCAYSDDYGHDETNHWQTCTLCGGKKTEAEAHGWVHQYTSATGIIRRSCDKCEIETVVGTVSITPNFSVTYGKTGSATLVCTAELADGYSLEPADSADNCWVLTALSDGKSWNLGRELEVKLPADLPAGEYYYNASPRLSYQGNNTIVKHFNVVGKVTVTPAPLTVTGAAAKDRTYDGTNSVQITGVTLDGVLNSDNVSVDLTGLTGTLSGSDAETYTSVTLPRLTLTGGAVSNYTLPQSMGAVPTSVTISKATLTATGATVASKTYDGNTAASVSSVTFTGLVPGEALALGQDYTAFGNYDDPNAGENKSATILVELKSSAKANNYTLPKDSSVNATGTITKASSSITTAPSATGITYGQALSDSTLTGGTGSVPGAFAWTDSTAKPNAGTAQFEVTFTPTDTNYNSTTTNVSVTVAKATPTLTAPTATAIQYGQKLTDSALTGGTATNPNGSAAIAGSWHWTSGNTQPTATGTFPVSFAPSDTANYNTPANTDTSVTVNPAAPKITLTVPADQVVGEDVIVTCTVENPHDATFKEGIPENITLTYQIGSGTPQTITNGKFSIPAGTKKDTVITVTASTDAVNGKYTAATKTATVTVTDKIPVEISGISVTGRVYNGQPLNYTGTPVVKKLDGTVVTDALVSYTWSSVTAPVNAGDYSLVIAVDGGKYIGSTTIPVVIEQAEIRVTAPSKTIYVGETAPVFSAADCNITGLVQGENLKTPPTVAYAEAPDTSKTGSVTVTVSGAKVPEGGNYKDQIVYENGTLTITSKPLPPAKYTVTVQAGTGGTASASPTSAEKGTKITLNATPDSGYHFKEWQVISGGVKISNNSFTMPAANVTVKAIFEKDGGTPPQPTQYSVTVQAGTGGTASASPTSAEKGTKITLNATPDSGYHFKEWQVISGGVKISNNSFTMPAANVTVKAVFERNSNGGGNSGGSGGGSSSGDNGSSGGGSTIVARPDETKPDTPTTSQTKPAAPDKNGNVVVDNGAVQSAINTAKNDAKKNGNTANGVAVVIPVSPQKGQTSFSVTIKAQTLDTLVREKVKRLEINIEGVIVEGMDADLLKWLDTASANGDIILRVKQISQASLSKEAKAAIGTRPVYDLSLVYLAGGKETPITDFDGHTIAVRLPYAPAKDEKTGNLYAVYVDGKGKVEWLTRSSYDPDLGTVVFEAGHFSIYGIGYKNPVPDFTDIKNHWAADNIIFVASRGLLTGTGNNQFSPNIGMTRGMFVTALGRLADIDPDSYKTGKFTDVKADAYYAPYVNWAAEKGIVNGTTSTTFSPDTNITREQMAVIMASYAKKLGYDLPAAHEAVTFADNAQISGWAAKKVKAMQQAGILAGKGGNRFDPKGTATRAEVATVLRRFVEIVIDPQTAQGWMQNHSGSWQYMKNGKPVTGWLQDDKKWYWLDNNGWMFTGGWKQIDGKWYYFYSDGSMAVNTTIDGYTIGPDGARK